MQVRSEDLPKMSSPCRVLVLNERDPHHPKAGGAEIHVAEIFRRLAARGYEVTLAVSSFPGCKAEEEFDGMRILRLGRIRIYYLRVSWMTAVETRKGNFDVVVLATTIQNHYDRTLPFAEFMSEIGQREVRDIRLDEIVEFVYRNLSALSDP